MTVYYPLSLTLLNYNKVGSYDIEVHQNDDNEDFIFQIVDAQGNPLNCTGQTVVLIITSPFYATYANTGTCAWTNINLGIFTYTPASTDFNTLGLFNLIAHLTNSSNLLTIPTANDLILNVI